MRTLLLLNLLILFTSCSELQVRGFFKGMGQGLTHHNSKTTTCTGTQFGSLISVTCD